MYFDDFGGKCDFSAKCDFDGKSGYRDPGPGMSDKCCYLFFVERPSNNNIDGRLQFDHDASFYPIAPLCNIDGYHSFIISKDKDYNAEKNDDKIPDYENLYYLRYKTNFNPNTKLYKYYTSFYLSKS